MRSWKIGFLFVLCVASLSLSPLFSKQCMASDFGKILDLLTKPPEEANKPVGGSQNQQGLPQLFQIFNKQPAPAAPTDKPKGLLTDALKDIDLGKEIEAKTEALESLSESSGTVELNHKKNQKLREAVKYMIGRNTIVGCAFGDVIDNQNVALDSLLNFYTQRLSQITEYQMTASEMFANISKEFKAAETEMRMAIE